MMEIQSGQKTRLPEGRGTRTDNRIEEGMPTGVLLFMSSSNFLFSMLSPVFSHLSFS